MRFTRHRYSEALESAAEEFLINQFEAPTQFMESGHLPDLIEAAMHIVTGAAWVQPESNRDRLRDALPDDGGAGYDDDEDEEDE